MNFYSWLIAVGVCCISGCGYYSVATPSYLNVIKQERKVLFLNEDNQQQSDVVMVSSDLTQVVSELYRVHPKSHFSIIYPMKVKQLVQMTSEELKNQGLPTSQFEFSQDGSVIEQIHIVYSYIEARECGKLTIHNHGNYAFGCSIKHNETISLLNPMKDY